MALRRRRTRTWPEALPRDGAEDAVARPGVCRAPLLHALHAGRGLRLGAALSQGGQAQPEGQGPRASAPLCLPFCWAPPGLGAPSPSPTTHTALGVFLCLVKTCSMK